MDFLLAAGSPDGAGRAFFLRGVLLGLGAAAPVGPVNVEIARRALRGGFGAGFALGCGAVSVDVLYAALGGLGFTRLFAHPRVAGVVGVAGVGLLAYLAVLSLRGARHDLRMDPIGLPGGGPPANRPPARAAYFAGVGMTLLNPMTLAFWLTVVPGQAASPRGGGGMLLVCAGVFAATLAWVVGFAGLLGWAGRWRRNWWLAAADEAGAVVLFGFAAERLLRLLGPFL